MTTLATYLTGMVSLLFAIIGGFTAICNFIEDIKQHKSAKVTITDGLLFLSTILLSIVTILDLINTGI